LSKHFPTSTLVEKLEECDTSNPKSAAVYNTSSICLTAAPTATTTLNQISQLQILKQALAPNDPRHQQIDEQIHHQLDLLQVSKNAACRVVKVAQPCQRLLNLKQIFLQGAQNLALPPTPLDDLINQLGGERSVAEMTGRKGRLVWDDNSGQAVYRARVADLSHTPNISKVCERVLTNLNIQEKNAFLDGHKLVAIISEAASTGISLHADPTRKNFRRRLHITIELPWSADKVSYQIIYPISKIICLVRPCNSLVALIVAMLFPVQCSNLSQLHLVVKFVFSPL
jgi:hypothetical protein